MNGTNKLLSIRNLKQYFPVAKTSLFQRRQNYVHANEDITLDIRRGETFGLVGESGCGKSTLGRTILQLYTPTSGSILYYGQTLEEFAPAYAAKALRSSPNAGSVQENGIDLTQLKPSEMRILRKDIQIIFQDPYSSLNPRMTVGQIIGEGLITHRFFKPGDPKMTEYILSVMERCGLQRFMFHRYPHQFSGGQRQRICIARSLAVKPKFIVCDECVSALDVSIQSQIINLLEELKEKEDLTYLFISHDLSVVRHISDRIGVMYLGSIVELGTAEEIFSDPRHPYTVALLSSIPTTDADVSKKERILLEGSIPSPIHPPQGCKFHTRCFMACEKCTRVSPPLTEISPGHFAACHFPDRKVDEKGNYLFDSTKSKEKHDAAKEN